LIQGLKKELEKLTNDNRRMKDAMSELKTFLQPQYSHLQKIFETSQLITQDGPYMSKYDVWFNNSSLPSLSKDILKILIEQKKATRKQILLRLGKKEGGHINNCFSKLTSARLMKREGEFYVLQEIL
jgi:hypothetical protein